VVLQAIPADCSKRTPIGDPNAQFFVLKDNVALRGSDITNPKQSTDPTPVRPTLRSGSAARAKYPDGIKGDNGADISGSFSITSAQDLANELLLRALPVSLTATG
jgi:preprotein translocase subunit SecD